MAHPETPRQPSLLAQNAFDEAAKRVKIDRVAKLTIEKKQRAVGLYVGSALSYFASHRDDRLSQIGSRVLDAIFINNVGIVVSNLNDDEVVALPERARPSVLPGSIESGGQRPVLSVPLNFVEAARQNPIEALLLILPAFCEIEARMSGMFESNPNAVTADIREMLTAFYQYAQGESPRFRSSIIEEMIAHLGNGPKVPQQSKGLTLDEFLDDLNK